MNNTEIKDKEQKIKEIIMELVENLMYLKNEIRNYKNIFYYIGHEKKVIENYNNLIKEIEKLKILIWEEQEK